MNIFEAMMMIDRSPHLVIRRTNWPEGTYIKSSGGRMYFYGGTVVDKEPWHPTKECLKGENWVATPRPAKKAA